MPWDLPSLFGNPLMAAETTTITLVFLSTVYDQQRERPELRQSHRVVLRHRAATTIVDFLL